MPAPDSVLELVDRFARNPAAYTISRYNETQARRELIDPLFEALGWDMTHRTGGLRQVVHEDRVEVAGKQKAPDYGFYVDGRRQFFVEAKQPSVDLAGAVSPAYQLRRYAWSAKLPLSVLTDFQEFAVYDTRKRPIKTDKPSANRLLYLTYADYPDRWDEIAATFGREAVVAGSLEQYAESVGGKRGTAEVDAEFLKEIERWRDVLARNFANRNPGLTQRNLNFAVQQTIDRIIFLRIAEDRGIEPYGRLQAITDGADIYARLLALFRAADQKYNSGLFHFSAEKGRPGTPDAVTPALTLDDKVLKDIIRNLYFPDSPYEFSVLPADILGNVYEQFLGKVIRLTDGHRAKIEEKPEVRKAGGVYYTPTYIVDYIVEQTVGKLLAAHTPDPTGPASRLRVLDPACGSGSFLIGAYQYLLDWHLRGYVDSGLKKWQSGRDQTVFQTADETWHLTLAERKRILLDNIYGVDIDPQAVEVTKLSLLLKVLEASPNALSNQLSLLPERVLPDLAANIKCGNSLIGPDYYDGRQTSFLDDTEMLRVNAFNWRGEFPAAFAAGGFDAVIGNPPYIRIQTMKEWAPLEVEFYKERYRAASKGNYDIYVVFVEKGLDLLSERGRLGFILPHKFFNAKYGEPLRGLIAEGQHLDEIVHFGHQQVFSGATTYTCLLFLVGSPRSSFVFTRCTDIEGWIDHQTQQSGEVNADYATYLEWNFQVGKDASLFQRLLQNYPDLGTFSDVFVGIQTSADDVYVMDYVSESEQGVVLYSAALERQWEFEPEIVKAIVSGTDVVRYSPLPSRQFLLFPYKINNEKATLMEWRFLREHYPNAATYLEMNKRRLEERERGKFKDAQWYRFGRNQNIGIQGRRKGCVPRLVEYLYVTLDGRGGFVLDNVDVCGITLKKSVDAIDLRYLVGMLNSSLLVWFFPKISAPFRGGWWSANRQFLTKLPIRTIDFTNPADVARHDRMVALVEAMLDLHRRLSAEANPHVKSILQRQIDATDKQIDRLVYELYELTEEEIGIVEGAA